MNSNTCRGFTLIEMLVVLAIIAVVSTLVISGLGSVRAQQLSTSANTLVAQFGEAQQLAKTLNRTVEMRFYRYADPDLPGSTSAYRARQILIHQLDGTVVPYRPVARFQAGSILASNPTFTTVLINGESSPGTGDLQLPRIGLAYMYFGILFQPGGGVMLGQKATDHWCVTLVDERSYQNPTVLPANFATLQLDPYNGSVKLLQP